MSVRELISWDGRLILSFDDTTVGQGPELNKGQNPDNQLNNVAEHQHSSLSASWLYIPHEQMPEAPATKISKISFLNLLLS